MVESSLGHAATGSDCATNLDSLSTRELEVLRLVASGATNADVSESMGLSVHAIKFHLASTYRKLGVSNRTEAAVAYINAMSSVVPSGKGSR
jgi:DNA-binding NarL/FixJ family response regulator